MSNKIVFCFYTNDHEVNLGVGFMSAALTRAGHETDLVIYRDVPGGTKDSPDEVVTRILEKKPAIVAFSAMTLNWHHIRNVISRLRPLFTGPVVVGGYHAILQPGEVLACPGVDAVCTGEGEMPLLLLAGRYESSRGLSSVTPIPGLAFKHHEAPADLSGSCWLIEHLEDYPYMDYEIFARETETPLARKHLGAFSPAGIFSLPVITGRGCPYRCTYCCNSVLIERYGGVRKYLRRYSSEAAIRNIRTLVDVYHPEFIEFFDETFTIDKQWVRRFCDAYRREIGLPFMIMNRIDSLDEPTVALLAASGLKMVLFGLESGDEEYRSNYLKRHMSNNTIRKGADLLRKHGVMILTFNMFGMPFETKEMVARTFALNEEIGPDAAFSFIFQPLPGTELARMAHEHSMAAERPGEIWDLQSSSLDTPELPAVYVREMTERFKEKYSNPEVVRRVYERLREVTRGAASRAS